MFFPYSSDLEKSSAQPQVLAHGGSHTVRDQQQPKQTKAPIINQEKPTSKTYEQKPKVSPPTVKTDPAPVMMQPEQMMESVLGLPFGLGELSLAAILVVPLSLMALKRILQS